MIQFKSNVDQESLEDGLDYAYGEVMIKTKGVVLFQANVELSHFWIIWIGLLENYLKKERKTIRGYYFTDFCLEKGKKDNIIFSIDADDSRLKLHPVQLNKKEFLGSSVRCMLTSYRELEKLAKKEAYQLAKEKGLYKIDEAEVQSYDRDIQHILDLQKRVEALR